MNTIGVLLLAAVTAGDGLGKPHVGGMRLLRGQAVSHSAPGGGLMHAGMMHGGAMMESAPVMTAGPEVSAGAQAGRRFPNTKSQIAFVDPAGMQISWQTSAGPNGEKVYGGGISVPGRYNFNQGFIYRLKLSGIANRPGKYLYPTIEVAPSAPATDAYLTHNVIPVQFTAEDFDQVIDGGNFVTKVIYLPDPKYQELAIAGVETLVSTRLEPGVDPIIEADKRGTILLIVRLGAIDLEMQGGYSAPDIASDTAAPAPPATETAPPAAPSIPAAPSLPAAPTIPTAPPANPAAAFAPPSMPPAVAAGPSTPNALLPPLPPDLPIAVPAASPNR